jgi:hypothetical protein
MSGRLLASFCIHILLERNLALLHARITVFLLPFVTNRVTLLHCFCEFFTSRSAGRLPRYIGHKKEDNAHVKLKGGI